MHELGIVFHIIKTVNAVAAENDVNRISAVTVELGEVSGVVPHYLTDCWAWAVKKEPLLEGAELRIEELPATTYCEGCGGTYPTVEHGKVCPLCGSEDTWLLSGNEMQIKEIEVV